MRIRQVKPAFWADAKIASLPHDARLFYIGLWMLADDDGWLRWDVAEIGKELYGFEGRASREKRIERMSAAISEALPGKLTVHECGHAELPKLAVHQHLAGTTRRVTTVHAEHSNCPSPRLPANPRDSAEIPANPRPVKVMVSKGDSEGEGEGVVSSSDSAGIRARAKNGSNELTNEELIAAYREKAANLALPEEIRRVAALEADRLEAIHVH